MAPPEKVGWASVRNVWAKSMTIGTIFEKLLFDFIQLSGLRDSTEEHSKQILRFTRVSTYNFLVLIDSNLAYLLMREWPSSECA